MQQHVEITLTPLIDTALTLLIIFIVTTPMIQNSIKIDLPKGNLKEAGSVQAQELMVVIDKEERVYFNNKQVSLKQLPQEINTHLAKNGDRNERVWIKIDETCQTKCLVSVIDSIKVLSGVKDVAIATEQAKTS